MTSVPNQNQYIPRPLALGDKACEGRKAITVDIDFALGASFSLDLSAAVEQAKWINSVQTLYIDNYGRTVPQIITTGSVGQRIIVPAGAQAYISLLQPNPPVVNISYAGSDIIRVQVLNFYLPTYVWNDKGALSPSGYIYVSDPILDATVVNNRVQVTENPGAATIADKSGTITTGGTGQVLMAANSSRLQWIVENPSNATEILQISRVSITGPWYDLTPGGSASENGSTTSKGIIWVKGATTGHAFTADEGI